MNESPLVSIILPTYNRPGVIERAVRSVLEQTYSDFELLVVDSSTDERTRLILEEFDDERIKYLPQAPKGPGAARNLGIDYARGEYLAFQDDDDVWHREKLEKQLSSIQNCDQQVGIIYTTIQKISDDTKWTVPFNEIDPKEGDICDSLQYSNFVSTQTVLARARCFDEVGQFDEALPALEDWEMWIRISMDFRFKHIDEQLVTAYISPSSLSRDFEAIAEARGTIVRKYPNYFDINAAAQQFFWSGHGFMKTGRTQQGRINLKRALYHKFRSKYFGVYLISLFGSRIYFALYRLFKSIPGRSKRISTVE